MDAPRSELGHFVDRVFAGRDHVSKQLLENKAMSGLLDPSAKKIIDRLPDDGHEYDRDELIARLEDVTGGTLRTGI